MKSVCSIAGVAALALSATNSAPADPQASGTPAGAAQATPAKSQSIPRYHAVVLNTLPDDVYCTASGLNEKHQICGYSQDTNRSNRPVTWTEAGGNAVTIPGGIGEAMAINADGVIVGILGKHATMWRNGTPLALSIPAGISESRAFGIDSHCDVVGEVINTAGSSFPFVKSTDKDLAVLPVPAGWTGGHASHIAESGLIAGTITKSGDASHACLWTDGKPQDLGTLGGTHSIAQDVNALGTVAGSAETSANVSHACLWVKGKAVDLGSLTDGDPSLAHAINDDGVVVGEGDLSSAAIWIDGKPHNLNDLVIEQGFVLGNATAIDKTGDVLAWGTVPGDDEVARAVLLIPSKP